MRDGYTGASIMTEATTIVSAESAAKPKDIIGKLFELGKAVGPASGYNHNYREAKAIAADYKHIAFTADRMNWTLTTQAHTEQG